MRVASKQLIYFEEMTGDPIPRSFDSYTLADISLYRGPSIRVDANCSVQAVSIDDGKIGFKKLKDLKMGDYLIYIPDVIRETPNVVEVSILFYIMLYAKTVGDSITVLDIPKDLWHLGNSLRMFIKKRGISSSYKYTVHENGRRIIIHSEAFIRWYRDVWNDSSFFIYNHAFSLLKLALNQVDVRITRTSVLLSAPRALLLFMQKVLLTFGVYCTQIAGPMLRITDKDSIKKLIRINPDRISLPESEISRPWMVPIIINGIKKFVSRVEFKTKFCRYLERETLLRMESMFFFRVRTVDVFDYDGGMNIPSSEAFINGIKVYESC